MSYALFLIIAPTAWSLLLTVVVEELKDAALTSLECVPFIIISI